MEFVWNIDNCFAYSSIVAYNCNTYRREARAIIIVCSPYSRVSFTFAQLINICSTVGYEFRETRRAPLLLLRVAPRFSQVVVMFFTLVNSARFRFRVRCARYVTSETFGRTLTSTRSTTIGTRGFWMETRKFRCNLVGRNTPLRHCLSAARGLGRENCHEDYQLRWTDGRTDLWICRQKS